METYGNEMQVQQGEQWNFDKLLSSSNKEYIPYLINNKLSNPFFVITVASTKFEKNLRYVRSWWNDINTVEMIIDNKPLKLPRFFQTVPQYCGELQFVRVDGKPTEQYESLPEQPGQGTFSQYTNNDSKQPCLYQYTKEGDDIDYSLGHKPYYYFYFNYNEDGTITRVDGYNCHVRFNFLTDITGQWGGQNYMYQISLVDGELMAKYLNDVYTWKLAEGKVTPEEWPNTIADQYKFVKLMWPELIQPDIDIDSPLGRITYVEPILPPTKLEVFNNLRRLI